MADLKTNILDLLTKSLAPKLQKETGHVQRDEIAQVLIWIVVSAKFFKKFQTSKACCKSLKI